jgi:hypothetical protein
MRKNILNFYILFMFSWAVPFYTADNDYDDDTLIEELLEISQNCYQKIIKTTALYFTGILINSDQFHQEIIFEFSKHLLQAGQVLAHYLPKLLKNPKIPWRVKAKRCSTAMCFMIATIFWMRNMSAKARNDSTTTLRLSVETTPNTNFNSEPHLRQRPSLH